MITKEINRDISFPQRASKLLSIAQDQNWSFVAWKAPDAACIHLLMAEEEQVFDFDLEMPKSGFCIAPFDLDDRPAFFFNKDYYINSLEEKYIHPSKGDFAHKLETLATQTDIKVGTVAHVTVLESSSEGEFKGNVRKAIAEIGKGTFKKVVVSRIQELAIHHIDVMSVFMDLCGQTTAFVSLLYSPSIGMQLGASPEILVKSNGTHFKTVALAGTQKHLEGMDLYAASWTQKEIEEQALVTRYIIECFKKIRLREYDDFGPKTVKAGNILHLKTEFTVDMEAVAMPQLPSIMLKLLHPTSAICGMPLEPALKFIKANEVHKRDYFSGFLGAINIKGETQIYVNIRCAKIKHGVVRFYAGAGITEDSDPDKEYLETENKIHFLRRHFLL